MAGKIKKILFATCGIIAALILALFANYSAFALSPASGSTYAQYSSGRFTIDYGWSFDMSMDSYANLYINAGANYTGQITGLTLNFASTIPGGSVIDIPYNFIVRPEYNSSITGVVAGKGLFVCDSSCVIYDDWLSNTFPLTSQSGYNAYGAVGRLRVYVPSDTRSVSFINSIPVNYGIGFDRASWWTPSDLEQKQIEVIEREEQEREEQKDKAENAGSDSESSSEDSQSAVDDASASLFDVLTKFVGAITGTSAGSCGISGDFGFFNAGTIDLCSGASKITPITTIVGTIMLLGLVIPGVLSLLHNFIDLFNEVTN